MECTQSFPAKLSEWELAELRRGEGPERAEAQTGSGRTAMKKRVSPPKPLISRSSLSLFAHLSVVARTGTNCYALPSILDLIVIGQTSLADACIMEVVIIYQPDSNDEDEGHGHRYGSILDYLSSNQLGNIDMLSYVTLVFILNGRIITDSAAFVISQLKASAYLTSYQLSGS